jgi:multiple sugar transport system permease protein
MAQAATAPASVPLGGSVERWVERHLRVLMLAPAVVLLACLIAFPTIFIFTAAFQNISPDPSVPREFAGFEHFLRMVDPLEGRDFRVALLNTLIFTVSAVTAEFLLGLGLALLLDRYIRRWNFLKTILMIPMMLPPIAVAITWKLIYQPQFGVLNELMFQLGLPLQAWAGDVNLAMFCIVLADIWEWTPFIFLLMLAGLASLPEEPYEAAELDGASAWRKFWDLTLPFLKPVIAIALLLRAMDALRLFDLVFILTGGGPAGATETLSLYIYKEAFRSVNIGYAAAISIVMLILTTAFSTWFVKRMRLAET